MAKVIFEFNCAESAEMQRNNHFYINMNVRLEEQSPEGQVGPHDLMAGIIKSMVSEIIEKATRALLESARERGLEVEGELFRCNPDAATH
ncbi:hypothetical protein MN350_005102 [Escherichia coli]|uniref:hypothetical protein n=1 Tax=Escherichia coli TaxID=562 RepID=UPI000BB5C636|nr:hypothetical protein [Escherichia coli]EEQ7975773.1 hypothetical protein [Escherichia coli]EEV1307774.1 hypothetical protein [Escherichia coli]EEV6657593.1 hypothetical protein [Escherichia coli]EFB4605968.1 hypothetical protein [Escherichia coli]EHI0994781.1 hypothetical protein [Escherichia coli]